MTEKEILNDENIYPSNEVLAAALGAKKFCLLKKFNDESANLELEVSWRFYRDTKSWLGKILGKKKNFGWLSIWNIGWKVTVFFTAKTISAVSELGISEKNKKLIKEVSTENKLIPVIITVENETDLDDVMKILTYKKYLK